MRRKLSTAAPRSELIASYAYAAPAVPPPPAKAPADAPADAGKPFEPAPYHEDPDETVICPACQKHNDVDASYCDQCGAKLAGEPGVKVEPAGEETPAPAAKTGRGRSRSPDLP